MRIVLILAAAALLAAVLRKPFMLRFYLQLAAGRTTKLLRFLGKALTRNGKDDPEMKRQMEWIHSQDFVRVETRSRDDLTLTGYYLENPRADRIILMFHGWRGGWDRDGAAFAHGLYERNCSVLMVSQRAHGLSGGKYIGFGVLERYDCRVPVFFAHGTADHFVPYEMTVENYQACTGRKTLYTAEGASHTRSYMTRPFQYMTAVSGFFRWEPAGQA